PGIDEPIRVSAPAPYARIRQIMDRRMSASMLIPSGSASERTNLTRHNNAQQVRALIEVRATAVSPARVLVLCQLGLEVELLKYSLPRNVEIAHYNNVAGQNAWTDVALVIVIGRTEPPPSQVEQIAR